MDENVNNSGENSAAEEKISAKKEIGAAAANDFKQCAEPFKQFKEPSFFADFLNFKVLITPQVIKALFYVSVIFGILGSIGLMFQGGIFVIYGLLSLILSPLFARIYCEFMYVVFGIFDNLKEAKEVLKEINQKTK